jgi:conjugal transfer pilus assembly protein TraB
MKITEFIKGLKAKDKRTVVKIVVSILLLIFIAFAYKFTRGHHEAKARADEHQKTLTFDERTFEKTIYTKTREEVEGIRKDMEGFKQEMRDLLSDKISEIEKKDRYEKTALPEFPTEPFPKNSDPKASAKSSNELPPMPNLKNSDLSDVVPIPKSASKVGGKKGKEEQAPKEIVVFENTTSALEPEKTSKISIRLPPSFMEANLLNGVRAAEKMFYPKITYR